MKIKQNLRFKIDIFFAKNKRSKSLSGNLKILVSFELDYAQKIDSSFKNTKNGEQISKIEKNYQVQLDLIKYSFLKTGVN